MLHRCRTGLVALACIGLAACDEAPSEDLAPSSIDTIVAASPLDGASPAGPGADASRCDTLRHHALLLEQRVRSAVAAEAHDALALNDERREASARHEACVRGQQGAPGDSSGADGHGP